jgi:cytochrome c biogenesis protein CcmG, thiol:disulfide interchange protein DsbE
MRGMAWRPLLTFAVVCIALTACTGAATSPSGGGATLPASPDALPQMDAATFTSMVAQQRGTPVVVNIWASWCPPCRAEAPDLAAAATRYGDRVRFIGVDTQDARSGATEYIARYHLPYPSVFDPTNAIAVSYGLYSPPATLFFDADGTLVRTVPGQISPEDLDRGLRAITSTAS